MNTIFQFELKHSSKHWVIILFALALIGVGLFCGLKFNLTVGEGIYLNSPYTIGFMMGMLSLVILFFAIPFSSQLLFKEWDSKFDVLFFALPFSKVTYLKGKFWFLFLKTFLCFTFLILGFVIGQNLRVGDEMQAGFNLWHYLYPLLIFGFLNCFSVCSFLFFIAYATRKKLLVVVGGLLLYVLYMVLLVFSNSPFMSNSLPQSLAVQQLSALLDPFGISAYFYEARTFSVQDRNASIVSLSNLLLINRLLVVYVSGFFLWMSYRLFSFSLNRGKGTSEKLKLNPKNSIIQLDKNVISKLYFDASASLKSVISFAKIDLIYLFKSITIVAVSLLLLFYVGMEMYAEIDKGIRLPEKYASSGLLATVIIKNFHFLGMLILTYFINDLYWRSQTSDFEFIEKSTYFSKNKLKGHLVSITILIGFFTLLLVAEAIVFQFIYNYPTIDFKAYFGVFIFNTFPLLLFSAFALLTNAVFKNRFVSLGVSTIAVLVFTTPIFKMILPYPLLQIFSGFKGGYSDFNGFGIYIFAFFQRLLFGASVIALLWLLNGLIKTKVWYYKKSISVIIIVILGVFTGIYFMNGYLPKNETKTNAEAVNYEKIYSSFKLLEQPTITDVTTEIDLFPSNNAYKIQGKYLLKNLTDSPIEKILINFHPDLKIENAVFTSPNENLKIDAFTTEIKLKKPLQPNEEATVNFKLSYKWFAVNGHQSFNAIINNGSFMRISNYFPTIGYDTYFELDNPQKRDEFQLDKISELKKIEAPEVFKNDFINLKMTVSTSNNQTAIGTGDLIKKWSAKNRNYFEYQAKYIPFRFAVSSAEYQQKSTVYKGIDITIYYTENHFENVDHLINNAKITLDYCIENFGAYPFNSINFAEVSSFTSGFAATAYPSAIFMTEDMIFHTNIQSDKKQDVINELAGHELSHLWWGNNQINPDEREGAQMLTETLAMYTEMMLYKKMYGKEAMMERLKIHQQIYDNEKGYYENQPLYKVKYGNSHIAYSKGAIVMVKLSNLIGEDQVNKALKNFLINNAYPKKSTSLDLLDEIYKVSIDENSRAKIDKLFKSILLEN
ncbi:ABC transporter permease/M1 family aminopeptidase [Polaribacter sp. Hel1_85]|uniref:ABC transporter permease/M1 family aminopeptidase n=1 Tax=Polaribacter sp. Hel1_85 TaxID=1250005 RepID=UPI00052D39F1|nr:M1 family aminopeptidase [Polaribacter sp. Hel1_85]KGL62760.1 aminopeptidase N, M1 family [Polaribacter sp. Hel1_85]